MDEKLVKCSKCKTRILKEDREKHEAECNNKKRQMPVKGSCKYCHKEYKSNRWLRDHELKCNKRLKENTTKVSLPKKKRRRKSIDPNLRKEVWDTYIGQATSAKCFCCWTNPITPFTYCNTFHAGHIISHAHGGSENIENLLPICRDCNMNMDAEDWDDYIDRHPNLPLRRCGKNPPIAKYMKGIIWLQSLVRMWIERKNPHSEWRKRWKQLKNSSNVNNLMHPPSESYP